MAGLVVSVAAASSNVEFVNIPFGRQLRWVVLVELCACALAYAILQRRRPRPGFRALAVAFLLGLALLSAAWSPEPSLTADRALSFVVLFAAAASLSWAAGGRPGFAGHVLRGIAGGSVVVALLGLVHLAISPEQAVIPATTGQGARYNGLGANPNSMAMLLALALPVLAWELAQARSRRRRAAVALAVLLLVGSIVASGSRGALLGAAGGVLVVALVAAPDRRRRLVVAAGIAGALVAGLLLMQVPPRAERDPVVVPVESQRPLAPTGAERVLPLDGEIGSPAAGVKAPHRGLFSSGGRLHAWRGAIGQVAERPLLGYGFGTEERVFVDRYYLFLAGRVENSYIGTALQLGVVGLVLVVLVVVLFVVPAARELPALPSEARGVAGACLGVVAAGAVLAATQSYLTAAGGVAAPSFWLCAFMLGAVAGAPRRRRA
ncbi:MAG: O-antigen ligase family protein [Gaiellaceae bacterium]